MTTPLSYPPACVLYVDGARFADGQPGEPDTAPVALTDLRVNWGRRNTLDQPSPATCTFRVLDVPGGQRFLEKLHMGGRVEVRAEAIIYPDPTISTIPVLLPGPVSGAVATGGTIVADGDRAAVVVYPPSAYSANPSAWDAVPRALAGQTWRLTATVTRPPAFAGWSGWAGEIRPVSFVSPAGPGTALPDVAVIPPGSGAATVDLSFVPPAGVWLGFQIRLWPVGPAWDELDATTWDQLPAGPGTLTNLATNPTPASITGWTGQNGTKWTSAYAGGEITVTRLAAADVNAAARFSILGNVANPTLPAVNYQRAVEVWVDTAGTLVRSPVVSGGFVTGGNAAQPLPAGQWTRVVEQFTGSATAAYVLGFQVDIPGVGTGAHVKVRRAQLIANPGGAALPYFDGSTPDAGGIDYAWTGTPNASTSTATSSGVAATWDSLATTVLSAVQMLAPAAGAARSGSVFTGRLTDMEASYDTGIGGTVVSCTAQDDTAELANRYVGDVPWGVEGIGTRFMRIVQASGQAVQWVIDPAVTNVQVSYKDIDRQPATKLLQELAQSVGGALWAATSIASGPFLRLEDVDSRAALFILTMGTDGLVHIIISSSVVTAGKAVELSACDVLLEPVSWVQDTSDASTRVDVIWKDQAPDPVKPTDRTIAVLDPVLEAATGQRRVSVSTQLALQADAQRVANSLLGRLSLPGWRVDGVTWRADVEEQLDADKLSTVMQILDGATRLGLGMIMTDLPEWTPSASSANQGLFLEGGVFTNRDGAWTLELLTSGAASQGTAGVSWDQVPADWSWDEFGPEVSWSDLAGVGI